MKPSLSRSAMLWCIILLGVASPFARSEEASFYRAVNLNGSPLVIDGREWEGKGAPNFTFKGGLFENQAVPLRPPTESSRAQMIRSSVWGGTVDLEFSEVPAGIYQVFLYVWEDNHSERFNVLANDALALEGFHSGNRGTWKKLGPIKVEAKEGKIKISGRGGAANFSGVEVWAGAGLVPVAPRPEFASSATPEQLEFFEKRIRPLLASQCYECHSAGAKKIGNNLLLDSRPGILKGGDSGPVITPGSPEASLLIQAVKQIDPDLTMPPKKKLAPEEITDLETWIQMGAPDPRMENTLATAGIQSTIDWEKARQFWSFRPFDHPPLPPIKQAEWPRNEIDYFILARLEAENLTPAADASKEILIRRASYDLTGLPPTPEEVEAFLADVSPDAFAKVVDRLLASQSYGERWGRHWLDVVRYADTAGDNSDFPIPQIYRYRNWVISALNRDLPYNDFIRHQLAGDLLPASTAEETEQRIIATGYIANARRFGSRVVDYPQHLTIEDTIDNLGRAFLGLTVSCARCHHHKFDPIPTEDYYALYGIFHSTRYPWPGIELDQVQRDLVPLVPLTEFEEARKAHQEKQNALSNEVARVEKEMKAAEGDERKRLQKLLAEAKAALDRHKKTPLPIEQAYAVQEASKIEDVAVQLKGDPAKRGAVVRRGFLQVLQGGTVPAEENTSGRLHLANWITTPENPLTARVMVNRIWLNHFGRGIVPTPNDFGRQGKPPTHPELLDFLAFRFVQEGWSLKQMHRLILLSRTYQLASGLSAEAQERDPNNELLSAFPRRRLDAESIRDTLLVLGENLDPQPGGPHPFPPQTDWKFTQHNPFKAVYDSRKRSVYLMTQRIQRHPYLAIFDGPDPAASTAFRLSSTTPLQALYLLNDPFVHEQAKLFAQRIAKEFSDDRARWKRASLLALGRLPESYETEQALHLLKQMTTRLEEAGVDPQNRELEAWQALARVVFRMNEFVYID